MDNCRRAVSGRSLPVMGDHQADRLCFRPLGWGEPSMGQDELWLPVGTVSVLLAEVEGSTPAWETDPAATEKPLAHLNTTAVN
jgi:hypothetical protein